MPKPINAEFITRQWGNGNRADKYANARRWSVALPAFRASRTRGAMKIVADAIYTANNTERPLEDEHNKPTDTVERLARAYKYFVRLLEVDGFRARQARRRYGYTRFALLWDLWLNYEFDISDKGFDYLNLELGNSALEMFVVDVEDESPIWKRDTTKVYSDARKVITNEEVPESLRKAAQHYIDEYDLVFPKPPNELKRKI